MIFLPPFVEKLEELDRTLDVDAGEEAKGASELAFVVVIAGGAFPVEPGTDAGRAANLRHPGVFRFDRWLDLLGAVGLGFFQHVGDVLGLLVEGHGHADGHRGLGETEEETVGEAVGLQPVQRAQALGPLLRKAHAAPADDVVTGPAGVGGADLETGGEDQAVDLVLNLPVGPVHHHTVFGETLHALAVGVDQGHVGAVEGGEVFVVEAGPLAELAVPRLQLLGHGGILDDGVHPIADGVHLHVVGQLHQLAPLLRGQTTAQLLGGLLGHLAGEVAEDLGPTVLHHVDLDIAAFDADVEVIHALLLPARLERGDPLGIGGAVGPNVHRRRRALEHVEVFGRSAEMGDALHRGGTGADDAHHLVAQLVQVAGGIAAGVVVVPTAGVEGVTLEVVDPGDTWQLGPVERAVGHGDELGAELITPVGLHDPTIGGFIPAQLGDTGLEEGIRIEVVMASNALGVFEDLWGEGVLGGGHDVAHLFQQRQIDVGFHVAGRPRVAVPIPGAPHVSGLFHQADALVAGLAEPGSHEQAAEAAADDGELHLIKDGVTGEAGIDVGVLEVTGELRGHLDVLLVAVLPQPLVALGQVPGLDLGRVEAQLVCGVPQLLDELRTDVRLRHRCLLVVAG